MAPPLVRPSPPPCGWSVGFMAVPRTCGRMPLPPVAAGLADRRSFMWSGLPIDADRGPAGRRDAANFAAGQLDLGPVRLAGRQRRADAGRAAQACRRGPAATRCCGSSCPRECLFSGRQLPTVGGASAPLSTWSPAFRPWGPGCIAFRRPRSAAGRSGHCGSDRTGSMCTRAGTPSLLRRKSIRR